MGYKVIRDFADMQDGGYVYKVGDEFPHLGHKPSIERISELSGSNNSIGSALIVEVKAKKKRSRTA